MSSARESGGGGIVFDAGAAVDSRRGGTYAPNAVGAVGTGSCGWSDRTGAALRRKAISGGRSERARPASYRTHGYVPPSSKARRRCSGLRCGDV